MDKAGPWLIKGSLWSTRITFLKRSVGTKSGQGHDNLIFSTSDLKHGALVMGGMGDLSICPLNTRDPHFLPGDPYTNDGAAFPFKSPKIKGHEYPSFSNNRC